MHTFENPGGGGFQILAKIPKGVKGIWTKLPGGSLILGLDLIDCILLTSSSKIIRGGAGGGPVSSPLLPLVASLRRFDFFVVYDAAEDLI